MSAGGGSRPDGVLRAATTHVNADSDALASLVALDLLEGPLTLVLPGSMDRSARRLWKERASTLVTILPLRRFLALLGRAESATLHVADTADPQRLGPLSDHLGRFAEVLAWDTHAPADGDLPRRPLAPAAACVSSLVTLIDERGIRPSPEVAGVFLVGIHEDSGHFTFPETTETDHRAAALCLGWGADPRWPEIYAPRGFTTEQLALMERMAHGVRFVDAGPRSAAILTLELDRYEPELAPLVGALRRAEGWPAAFLVASLGGRLYVLGRSDGELDVAEVLRPLGGGGRPGAASTRIDGVTLPGAVELIAARLTEPSPRVASAGSLAVRPFVSLPSSESVREAAETLHAGGINALPLTEEEPGGTRYTGLVTRREVDAALRHGLGDRPVGEIAARRPAWVAPGASLAEARAALLASGGRLVLVGRPPSDAEGILTRTALLLAGSGEPRLAPPRRGPHRRLLYEMSRRALADAWGSVAPLGPLANRLGMSAHLVGGCVRDVLLERRVRDVDVVVEGDAPTLAREAARELGGRVHVHDAFRTARWMPAHGAPVDLATARAEFYATPASLPRVLHAELRRDLYRRDFTINAMAVSLDPEDAGTLSDPYHGYDDLKNGLLRVLHGLSFHDDPTRAFRAARFAARFDFRLAPQTEGLLRAALRSGAFERLSFERLGQEIELLLAEEEVEQALRLLREWRLDERIDEGLRADATLFARVTAVCHARYELRGVWRTGAPESPVPSQPDALWVVLAGAIPAPRRAPLARMVPGTRARKRRFAEGPERVARARERVGRSRARADAARALSRLDRTERVVLLGILERGPEREAVLWWEREGRHVAPAVDGDRLIALGGRPGPLLGRALAEARRVAWDGGDEAAQLEAARRVLEGPASPPPRAAGAGPDDGTAGRTDRAAR